MLIPTIRKLAPRRPRPQRDLRLGWAGMRAGTGSGARFGRKVTARRHQRGDGPVHAEVGTPHAIDASATPLGEPLRHNA